MADTKHVIRDKFGKQITIIVRRDKRLKKSSRWLREPDGSILVRIPYRLPKRQIQDLLDQIAAQLEKREVLSERRTDEELQQRAETINKKYFEGKIQWSAIRWVGNMNHRLGSCSNGGPTDGHIRISDRIRNWPQYVIDYIIAHELVHRLHPNHSKEFWDEVREGYPLADKAIGFVEGIGFAKGEKFEED
jgi:predicted metal-dependent hydrolase